MRCAKKRWISISAVYIKKKDFFSYISATNRVAGGSRKIAIAVFHPWTQREYFSMFLTTSLKKTLMTTSHK